MEGYCLLLLTLMFVGTCTGRGHVQMRRSQQSANGSSIEEIMNELDTGYCYIESLHSLLFRFIMQ